MVKVRKKVTCKTQIFVCNHCRHTIDRQMQDLINFGEKYLVKKLNQ
ncbi:MAG: hypothetical protein BAJALOKI1v1_930011 [Promethearchaeota archaeon]|nr:MAG: hypothetical protein BAJALOKI1v1_930011 [Candidatus Lokiarchaeota archaeon]